MLVALVSALLLSNAYGFDAASAFGTDCNYLTGGSGGIPLGTGEIYLGAAVDACSYVDQYTYVDLPIFGVTETSYTLATQFRCDGDSIVLEYANTTDCSDPWYSQTIVDDCTTETSSIYSCNCAASDNCAVSITATSDSSCSIVEAFLSADDSAVYSAELKTYVTVAVSECFDLSSANGTASIDVECTGNQITATYFSDSSDCSTTGVSYSYPDDDDVGACINGIYKVVLNCDSANSMYVLIGLVIGAIVTLFQ